MDIPFRRAGFQPVAAHGEFHAYPGASGARTFNDNNYTYYSFARAGFPGHGEDPPVWLLGSTTMSAARAPLCRGRTIFTASSTRPRRSNPDNFNGGIGYVAPQVIYNMGADITITPTPDCDHAVWIFLLQLPRDRGLPVGIQYIYRDTNYPYSTGDAPALATTKALNGTAAALAVREFHGL